MASADQITAAAVPATSDLASLQAVIDAQANLIADLQTRGGIAAKAVTVDPKLYFSTTPFCNIYVMRSPGYCEQFSFVAGRLETEDSQVQAHLDAICNKPGSGITDELAGATPEEVAAMRKDLTDRAAIAHGKMLAAGLPTA